jgi:serine protease inhibitor
MFCKWRCQSIRIGVALFLALIGSIVWGQSIFGPDEIEMIRKLDTPVSYSFEEAASLNDVLQIFRDEFGMPIELDEQAIERPPNIMDSWKISRDFKGEEIPLRTVLDVIFLQERLAWTVWNGRVIVTRPQALMDGRFVSIRYYDVNDLIYDPDSDRLNLDPNDLLLLLRGAIESPPKTGKDGPGALGWTRDDAKGYCLGVRHSFLVHESIDWLLSELRRMNVPVKERPHPPQVASMLRHHERMNRHITFDSSEPTISEVIPRLEETLGMPVIILERVWRHRWGDIQLTDSNCTVEEAIDFLCEGLYVEPVFLCGALWLDEKDEFPLPIRIYDVSILVDGSPPKELVDVIQSVIDPESWGMWGGEGYCQVVPQQHGVFLVVRQTEKVFLKIEGFLRGMKLVADQGPSMSDREWETAQDEWKDSYERRTDAFGGNPSIRLELPPPRVEFSAGKGVAQDEIIAAAEGINRFAFDLYEHLAASDEDGNLFFAPSGISNIVAVPYMGASGETADEMRQVMHFPASPDEIGPIYAALTLATESPAVRSEPSSSSSAWPGGLWSVPQADDEETIERLVLPQFDGFEGFGNQEGFRSPRRSERLNPGYGPGMGTFNGPPCEEFQDHPSMAMAMSTGGLTPAEAELLGLVASPIRMANGLWVQPEWDFQESFLTDAKKYFGATVAPLDFRDPDHAASVINEWSSVKTQGLISDLFNPSHFPEGTNSFFANGIHYEAYWNAPFSPQSTELKQDFQRFDGSVYPIPLMVKQEEDLPYYEHDGTQVVQLEYENSEFKMLLLLPPEGKEAYKTFESSLSQELLTKIAGSLEPQRLNLSVPRFEMTSAIQDLPGVLKSLGMASAFGSTAEFPGMLEGDSPFCLGEGTHRALLQVTEEKTVAAAMGGMGGMGGMPPEPPKVIEMRIDRPFLLMIRHEPTGMIVFMGRIIEPTAYEGGAW